MKCDGCHQETGGVSILGIMHHDRIAGRKPASFCDNCTDIAPCGTKGYWWDGHLTCKHGYVYDIDYLWEEGFYREVAEQAKPFFKLLKRKWWSYLAISSKKHLHLILINWKKW